MGFVLGSRFQVELYIDTGNRAPNKAAFDSLMEAKDAIEDELAARLEWQRLDNRRACRLAWFWNEPVTIMDSQVKLVELQSWAVDSYFRFRDALSAYVENVEVANPDYGELETESTP